MWSYFVKLYASLIFSEPVLSTVVTILFSSDTIYLIRWECASKLLQTCRISTVARHYIRVILKRTCKITWLNSELHICSVAYILQKLHIYSYCMTYDIFNILKLTRVCDQNECLCLFSKNTFTHNKDDSKRQSVTFRNFSHQLHTPSSVLQLYVWYNVWEGI